MNERLRGRILQVKAKLTSAVNIAVEQQEGASAAAIERGEGASSENHPLRRCGCWLACKACKACKAWSELTKLGQNAAPAADAAARVQLKSCRLGLCNFVFKNADAAPERDHVVMCSVARAPPRSKGEGGWLAGWLAGWVAVKAATT